MKAWEKYRKYLLAITITAIIIALGARAATILWQGTTVESSGTVKPVPSARVSTISIDLGDLHPGNETSTETWVNASTNIDGATIKFWVEGVNLTVLQEWEIRIYDQDNVLKGIIDYTSPNTTITLDLPKGTTRFRITIRVVAGEVSEPTIFKLCLKALVEA